MFDLSVIWLRLSGSLKNALTFKYLVFNYLKYKYIRIEQAASI